MLAQFRAFAKTTAAKVLMGLILAGFAGLGVRTGLSGAFRGAGAPDAVVQAGGHVVNSARFKRTFDGYLDQLRQQSAQQGRPQEITVQDALAQDVDRRLAEQMGDDAAFGEMLDRMGVRASDSQVLAQIRKVPGFFDPVSGRFDKRVYESRLAQAGLTSAEFEAGLRDEAAQQQFVAAVLGGLRAPRVFAATEAVFNREGRSFSYFVIGPDKVQQQGKPTDAQLLAFMKTHADKLTRPPMRQLSVVHFSTAALAPTVTADPAQVAKRFAFEKDSLSTPERRSLVQISTSTAAAAATAAARLKAGDDPAAVAKAVGGQFIPYQAQPQSAIGDRKVAAQAFRMSVTDVAGPVQGDLGFAAVRLTAVLPGHAATLEEARPKIEAEVKADAARAKTDALVSKFEDIRNGGATIAAAAKQVGATLAPLTVTAEGIDVKGAATQTPPQVLRAAFATATGADSDVVDLKNGEYWAVHVDRALPAALVSLDDFRPQITQAYVVNDVLKRMSDRAAAAAEQVRHGQSMAAAASSVGAPLQTAVGVARDQAGQAYSRDLLARVFGAKPGEVLTGEDVRLGFVVARLDAVAPPPAPVVAASLETQRQSVTRSLFESLGGSTRAYARRTVKPRIDETLARRAVGGADAPGGAAQ